MLKWTDDLVKEFCRVYSNGCSSYYGRTLDEKLKTFKKDEEQMEKIKIPYDQLSCTCCVAKFKLNMAEDILKQVTSDSNPAYLIKIIKQYFDKVK